MPWSLDLTRPAPRDLERLSADDRRAVGRALDNLTREIGNADLAKLAGREGEWRLRVGRWRVILEMDNASGRTRVIRVLPRGRAYR